MWPYLVSDVTQNCLALCLDYHSTGDQSFLMKVAPGHYWQVVMTVCQIVGDQFIVIDVDLKCWTTWVNDLLWKILFIYFLTKGFLVWVFYLLYHFVVNSFPISPFCRPSHSFDMKMRSLSPQHWHLGALQGDKSLQSPLQGTLIILNACNLLSFRKRRGHLLLPPPPHTHFLATQVAWLGKEELTRFFVMVYWQTLLSCCT